MLRSIVSQVMVCEFIVKRRNKELEIAALQLDLQSFRINFSHVDGIALV